MFKDISILAGRKALESIKEKGFQFSDVKVIAGASGAAKFLVLTELDRYILTELKERKEPLDLIGSSIGAFRMAAYAQKDPIKAIDILENEYIEQAYETKKPQKEAITAYSRKILDSYIKDEDIESILEHKIMKLSFLSVKSKYLSQFDFKPLLMTQMVSAGFLNLLSRRSLSLFFDRAWFASDIKTEFCFGDSFKTHQYPLNTLNFKKALMSSGAIPFMMDGVQGIEGADGVFRDGGMLDYHLDLPLLKKEESGMVLFPHFYDKITPGWFDKFSSRKGHGKRLEQMLLVSPSKAFVERLPYGKIPDRVDFAKMENAERKNYWRTVTQENKRLAEAFQEAIETGKIAEIVKPL